MQARMTNPAMIVPDAMQALVALASSVSRAGVPQRTARPASRIYDGIAEAA